MKMCIRDRFKGDCTTNYEFVVIDCANEHCNASINVGKVCCDTKPDCKISEMRFEKSTCDSNKNFYVYLNFDYKGNSECFRVKGNGNSYGEYKYANLPIKLGPFKGDCTTIYEFVVIDCANEHCNNSINVGKVCCCLLYTSSQHTLPTLIELLQCSFAQSMTTNS